MRSPRLLGPALVRAARQFPALLPTGPRRSGETTLLRRQFPGARWVLLEDPDILERVRAEARGFLDYLKPPVVLDEVQNAPELLSYVRTRIDSAPRRTGSWLLTGSQEAPLMPARANLAVPANALPAPAPAFPSSGPATRHVTTSAAMAAASCATSLKQLGAFGANSRGAGRSGQLEYSRWSLALQDSLMSIRIQVSAGSGCVGNRG